MKCALQQRYFFLGGLQNGDSKTIFEVFLLANTHLVVGSGLLYKYPQCQIGTYFYLFLLVFVIKVYTMPILSSRSKLNVDAFPLQFQQDLTYLKSSDKGNADSNDDDDADSSAPVCYTLA